LELAPVPNWSKRHAIGNAANDFPTYNKASLTISKPLIKHQLVTMAPAPHDPVSATATDPALCGACSNLATITCTGCNNMQYCSQQCLQRDSGQHNTLCSTFQTFQERPTPKHYRAIYFPPNETSPRFIWLRTIGERGDQNIDRDDLARYVSGKPSGRLTVTKDLALNRELNNFMVIEHDDNMLANRPPPNQCLIRMIGPIAARWLGDYVVHAFKYTYSSDPDSFHPLDQDGYDFPLIALDLDTTSLGPLIARLKWMAEKSGSC
jgi:hypothetical protein